MVQVVICEDEVLVSDTIRQMVSGFFRRKGIEAAVTQLTEGEELLAYSGGIDILFLDIKLGKMDGMEAAKRLRNRGFSGSLIFITVLAEMVFHAFEVRAYDFLVKPLEAQALERTMERLMGSLQKGELEWLFVQNRGESRLISFEEIVFCESIDRKIYLHLNSGEVVAYYEKLASLETKLDKRFLKNHRSYLVNLAYVKSYKNGTVYLTDGSQLPVSRLRGREFSEAMLHYLTERS